MEVNNNVSKEMSGGCFLMLLLFFLLVGVSLTYWGYIKYQYTTRIIEKGVQTTGIVVNINSLTAAPTAQKFIDETYAPELIFEYSGDSILYS